MRVGMPDVMLACSPDGSHVLLPARMHACARVRTWPARGRGPLPDAGQPWAARARPRGDPAPGAAGRAARPAAAGPSRRRSRRARAGSGSRCPGWPAIASQARAEGGHVVALAAAGGAHAGEEGRPEPVGLPLLALLALLEAVVLEQAVELARDRGQVAQDVPVDVDARLVAQLLEEPAAQEDVAEALEAAVVDDRPEHPVDDPEVVLVGLLAGQGVVDLALPAGLLQVQQGALEGLAGVLARLLPAEVVQQPVLGEGHRRGGRLLELEPARAEPDDRHVAVAADRRAGGLADRAEAVGDRHAGGDLEALARARAVGEAVLERLLEAAQVVGLAERELGLGADHLDVVGRAGAERGRAPGRGRGERSAAGGAASSAGSLTAGEDGARAGRGQITGVDRSRRGRAADAARPAAALLFFPITTNPNSRGRRKRALCREKRWPARESFTPVGRESPPPVARRAGYPGARAASPGVPRVGYPGRASPRRPCLWRTPRAAGPGARVAYPGCEPHSPGARAGYPGSRLARGRAVASRLPRVGRVAYPRPGQVVRRR